MATIGTAARAERAVRAAAEVVALGRRVHDIRAARGLSLQEFATLTGITAPNLAALERGEPSSSLSTLFVAVDALRISMRSLFVAPERVTDAAPPGTPEPPAAPSSAFPIPQHPIPQHPTPQHPIPRPWTGPVTTTGAGADHVPRTFADLRTGALEGRVFDTLQQFAVAAVLEARFSVAAIARVFRVPAWKLQGWVDEKDAQR